MKKERAFWLNITDKISQWTFVCCLYSKQFKNCVSISNFNILLSIFFRWWLGNGYWMNRSRCLVWSSNSSIHLRIRICLFSCQNNLQTYHFSNCFSMDLAGCWSLLQQGTTNKQTNNNNNNDTMQQLMPHKSTGFEFFHVLKRMLDRMETYGSPSPIIWTWTIN